MSSLLGHALIGSALFARKHKIDTARALVNCCLVIGLAASPDIDYLINWLFAYAINPRYTHSLLYCLTISLIAWCFVRLLKINIAKSVLFFAPLSHLVLDLLVGVYPMPLFWPLNSELITLPFGILPSAGRLQWDNYYLWRNLFIEIGILLPIVIIIVPSLNKAILKNSSYRRWGVFCVFLSFVLISINLNR